MSETPNNSDLLEVQRDSDPALLGMLSTYRDADCALPEMDLSEAETRYPDDTDMQKRFLLYLLMSRISRKRVIPDHVRKQMRDQFMAVSRDVFGDDVGQRQAFMADLYKVAVYHALDKFVAFLESPEFQKIISVLGRLNLLGIADAIESGREPNIDGDLVNILVSARSVFGRLMDLTYGLAFFGFDRPKADTRPDKLFHSAPLDTIDINDPRMESALIVAENFRHAMCKVFDVQTFGSVPDFARDFAHFGTRIPRALHLTCQAIPGVISLFRAFKNQLIPNDKAETVPLQDVSIPMYRLLCNRMHLDTHGTELPVVFRSNTSSASINSSSIDEIFLALWEVLKNTMRQGKVDPAELMEYSHENPYAGVIFDEGTVDGREVTTIEVIDRGAPINLPGIIEKIIAGRTDLSGYGARDISINELFAGIRNVGDLFSLLSRRNLSIPVGDQSTISTGTGLHVAIELIRKNQGELFCANLPAEQGGGVSFMLVFPKEGKESPVSISDMDLSGTTCASLSHNLVQKMALYKQFEQGFRIMARKEDSVDAISERLRVFVSVLLTAIYVGTRPTPPSLARNLQVLTPRCS